MSAKKPEPDEYGRIRVRDKDTGHHLSINASAFPHGNYALLVGPASDAAGNPLPPEFHESLSSPTTRGQSAGTKKENDNG